MLENIATEMCSLAGPFVRAVVGAADRRLGAEPAGIAAKADEIARDAALWKMGCRSIHSWADSVDAAVLVALLRVRNHHQFLMST